MGIVLYQLLTGRVPFSAESDYQLMKSQIEDPPPPPKKYANHHSSQLQTAILCALSKSSKDRYANVRQFADALTKCPESRHADQENLEDLVKCLRKKHPIDIIPLNQQAVKALQAEVQADLKSEKNRNNRSMFGMEQQKELPSIQSKRSYLIISSLVISFLALILGAFVFWFILQNSSKTSKNEPASGYKEQPSHAISDDRFEQKETNDHKTPPLEQEKESQWIIKR
jgi:serine/threonine protein kinase